MNQFLKMEIGRQNFSQFHRRTVIAKVTANVIGAHYFDSQFHVQETINWRQGEKFQHGCTTTNHPL